MPDTPTPPPYLSGSGSSGHLPPPGGQGPGGFDAPVRPAGGALSFDTGNSIPAAKGSPGPGLVIGIVVAVVVVAGLVVFALTRGGGGGLDAERAAEGFTSIVDDAEFVDGSATLRRCPLGAFDDLAAKVAGVVEIDDEVLDEREEAGASDDPVNEVFCTVGLDPDDVRGIFALTLGANDLPRGDYADFLEDLGERVRVEDPVGHDGGQLYAYCDRGSSDVPGRCGADWVDEDNDLALYTVLDGGDDPQEASRALRAVLSDMVAALADAAED